MDSAAPRSETRHSDVFDTHARSQALTAACIAEAVSELVPREVCVTTLFQGRAPWVVASRGVTLDQAGRAAMHTWAQSITHAELQPVPGVLRHKLHAFRAIVVPLASPLRCYGAVVLGAPVGQSCSAAFRRELSGVCTDWVLRIEENARAELRPRRLGRSMRALEPLSALA